MKNKAKEKGLPDDMIPETDVTVQPNIEEDEEVEEEEIE